MGKLMVDVGIHNPTISYVRSYVDAQIPFHVITVANEDESVAVKIYVDGDWSNWDEIVSYVQEYRRVH